VSTTSFPGVCTGLQNGSLASCLDTQVECRVCTAINEMDGLFVNCDLFDDGAANTSCASGTGPTPTPTPTLTATPGPTGTPSFQGAIAKTNGNWFYDAVAGIDGGELECNDHFPGTHVCAYTELLDAETRGELVGITDVTAAAVSSFWVVDKTPGMATDATQCISNPAGGIRWFYCTAHFNSQGTFATLNNGTGDLGSPSAPVSCCATQHSVGCCF
jgi:hypothetical protein